MKNTIIIFDMDGTILNTLEDLTDSCNYILQKYNYPLRTIEEIRSFVGNGIPKLIERAFGNCANCDLLKTATKEFIDYYEDHSTIKTSPYEGIIERGEGEIIFEEDITRCNKELDELKEILESDAKCIISVGRFSPEKGQRRMIDAFNKVWQENKNSYSNTILNCI